MNTLIKLADLATEIDQAHGRAVAAAATAIEHARRCGELLMQAKARIGHGGFLAWLESNCIVKERQARNYMRLAEHWAAIEAKTKSAPGADLTIKGALRLIGQTANRNIPATSARLPKGFVPQPGKYLFGQHRLFEDGMVLAAESAKHPGFWHVYWLDGKPRPNGGGADASSKRPVVAEYLAGMFHHFLQAMGQRPEDYDWTVCDAHGCGDGYPGKFVDDMAEAAHQDAEYWWSGRKGGGR